MHIPEDWHQHLCNLLRRAVKVARAVLGSQTEARAHLFGRADLQPVLQLLGQLLTQCVRHLVHLHRISRHVLALYGGLNEPDQRLLIKRLVHVSGQDLPKFLLNFLLERQHRVTLGLFGTELRAVFEHLDLRLGVLTQLVRLLFRLCDDGVRLLLGVGQDGGSLLVGAVDPILLDGRDKVLNLKFHTCSPSYLL